ncbi:MAG: hypothetical protein K6G91_12430 [Kiritimatiellae bacterium]|nr:hypothetical protein [Kiritimatiellia bacterium]
MEKAGIVAKADIATELVAQYRRAEGARGLFVREAVAFGVMLMKVEGSLVAAATKLNNYSKRGRIGEGRPNNGLEDWLELECPEINYNTAKGYKSMAVKMAEMLGGATPEVLAALEHQAQAPATPEIVERREELFAKAESRRKLEQLYFEFCGGKEQGAAKKVETRPLVKMSRQDEAKAIWNGVMQVVSKSSVRDAIPLLGAKETRICHEGLRDLVALLKRHLEEF